MALPSARKFRGRRFWRWIAAAAALILAVGLVAAWALVRPYGETGSTYLAKQLCSCVFLTGRTDASCLAENGSDVRRFDVRIDHAGRTVSARLLLFSSIAAYDEGYGCRIVR